MKKIIQYVSAVFLLAFGLLSLFLTTSIVFDLFGIRAMEGNYVQFIVIANFISSILYIFAAFGFFKMKKWTTLLLGISSVILFVSFVALKIYISNGGIFETKTVNAMMFRTTITIVLTLIAFYTISKDKTND